MVANGGVVLDGDVWPDSVVAETLPWWILPTPHVLCLPVWFAERRPSRRRSSAARVAVGPLLITEAGAAAVVHWACHNWLLARGGPSWNGWGGGGWLQCWVWLWVS